LTIVLSTHEPEHAFIVADQVAILGRDRFVTGAPTTTMTSDELSRLYGLPITIEQTPSGRSVVVPAQKKT
jgi:iron complex transport system ATP-binding protein